MESVFGEGDEDTFPIIDDDEKMIQIDNELPSNSLLLVEDDDGNDGENVNDFNGTTSAAAVIPEMKVRSITPNPTSYDTRTIVSNSDSDNDNDSNGSCNRKKKSPSIMDGLTLYSVTGSFVDSLCTSTACVVSDSYTSSNSNSKNNNDSKTKNNVLTSKDDTFSQFQQSCHSALFNRCPVGQSYWQSPNSNNASSSRADSGGNDTSCKAVVSMDIMELLGCTKPPGQSELEEIWSLQTAADVLRWGQQQRQPHHSKINERQGPVRASIRRRLKRIHRLRMDDRRIIGMSRHGVTITNQSHDLDLSYNNLNTSRIDVHMNTISKKQKNHHCAKGHQHSTQHNYRTIDKTYSMIDDQLSYLIGHDEIEAIPIEFDEDGEGYDSDPEVNYCSVSSSMIVAESSTVFHENDPSLSTSSNIDDYNLYHHNDIMQQYPISTDEAEMRYLVQVRVRHLYNII